MAASAVISHSRLDRLDCSFKGCWDSRNDANTFDAETCCLALGRVVSISCAPAFSRSGGCGNLLAQLISDIYASRFLRGSSGFHPCDSKRRKPNDSY